MTASRGTKERIQHHFLSAQKRNGFGCRFPICHKVEALARVLLPEIQAFFESEEGQREFTEWKNSGKLSNRNRCNKRREHLQRCSRLAMLSSSNRFFNIYGTIFATNAEKTVVI